MITIIHGKAIQLEIEAERVRRGIQSYLETKIFPQQNPKGGFGLVAGSAGPMITYEVVRLTRWLGLSYPNRQALLADIAGRRVDGGWADFVILNLDHKSQHTFRALQIAGAIEYTDYDRAKVDGYLRRVLLDDGSTLKDIYYAVASLDILEGGLPQDARQAAEAASLRLARRLPNDLTVSGSVFQEYGYFVLATERIGFDMPEDPDYTAKDLMDAVALLT